MKPSSLPNRSKIITFLIVAFIFLSPSILQGCDALMDADPSEDAEQSFRPTPTEAAPFSADYPALRHPQMMKQAKAVNSAGKLATETNLFVAFNVYEADGITKRILDKYGITRRVLDKYGDNIRLKVSIDRVVEGISVAINDTILDTFLQDIAEDPDFSWAEPDAAITLPALARFSGDPNDHQMIPWGIDRIGADAKSFAGSDVHVYVLDSGVFERDLNIVEKRDFTMLYDSRSFTTISEEELLAMTYFDPHTLGNPADESGHGTHVMGTIGAMENAIGVRGIAPGVKIHSLKVLNAQGQTDMSTVMAALDYVLAHKIANPNKAIIVNLSLGANIETTAYNVLDEAVKAVIGSGITVVAAAGNNGMDAATYSPAHVEDAITVGAFDITDRFAPFSNHGPAVDILAPGDLIVSLTHMAEEATNHENILLSGTSFAAPHVTGAVVRFLTNNPNASPRQVKEALILSATAGITQTPLETTAMSVSLAPATCDAALTELQVPPFFQYAIATGGNLNIKGSSLHIGGAPGNTHNINTFANKNIRFFLSKSDLRNQQKIEGFGYYGGRVSSQKLADQIFQPNANPNQGAVTIKADPLEMPNFNALDYQHLATKVFTDTLHLSGHYVLGTRENPEIWLTIGNYVVTDADVSFEGYGVIMSTEKIEISNNLRTIGTNEETQLALYTNTSIIISASQKVDIAAQLFAQMGININAEMQLKGNITAGRDVSLMSALDLEYLPASPALTNIFWPMETAPGCAP